MFPAIFSHFREDSCVMKKYYSSGHACTFSLRDWHLFDEVMFVIFPPITRFSIERVAELLGLAFIKKYL
jgi:hypothetical protein